MAEFPYTPKPSSLPDFLAKIQTIGRPDKVTLKYIASLGFKSKSDRYISGILKSLGFTDSSGIPTGRWQTYRDKRQAQAELAVAIREAYSDLFAVYPNAHRKDDEALKNFFTSTTSVGEKAVSYMVRTFKTLCKLADFTSIPQPSPAVQPVTPPATMPQLAEEVVRTEPTQTIAPSLNFNIQVHISPDASADQIDQIFASIAKHLQKLR